MFKRKVNRSNIKEMKRKDSDSKKPFHQKISFHRYMYTRKCTGGKTNRECKSKTVVSEKERFEINRLGYKK